MMIEIALTAWRPEEISGLRIVMAAVSLLMAGIISRSRFPRSWRSWAYFLVIAVVGNCLPFFLISWGQTHVESGLAGILASSMPLFVLILAHFVLPDERFQRRQGFAFLVGFGGIVVLMGPDSLNALGGSLDRFVAQLAILAGAVGYAIATVIARRMPPTSPLVTSAGVMMLASAVMTPFIVDGAASLPAASGPAIWALGFLGVLGTGLASILYFYLIAQTGARFTSLLNYLVPVWALALGALILGEEFHVNTWLGLILVLGGLILISKSGDIVPDSAGREPKSAPD